MTPRTEAGRAWLADANAAATLPVESWAVDAIRERILAIEAEQDAGTRKELAAKVEGLRPPFRHDGTDVDVLRAAVLAILSGEPEP